MNIRTLQTLIDVTDTRNLPEDQEFNTFRIIRNNRRLEDTDFSDYLFFPITITPWDMDVDGWYEQPRDLRQHVNNIVRDFPKATIVVEPWMIPTIEDPTIKLVVVENIMQSVDALFMHKLMRYTGKVILVTGSVGKTSTCGLIEDVIEKGVMRIYSKRITPLVLKDYFINYIDNSVEYLVMEAALFYRHHVNYFGKVLKPHIAVLLNVENEHLSIDGISSLEDICYCKAMLLKHAEYAVLNSLDPTISKLQFYSSTFSIDGKEVGKHHLKGIHWIQEFDKRLIPKVPTRLSYIQNQIAYEVGKILGIDEKAIVSRINAAGFVENRMQFETLHGRRILFDGDVSGVARMDKFTDHCFEKAVLVIRKLTEDGEEDEDYPANIQFFDRFDKVYIFDNIALKDYYAKHPAVVIVSNHDFMTEIPEEAAIFYHYGSYFRTFPGFDETLLD